MSRGFVKEGDQEETPIIPPRAALPPGEINYVTPEGMRMLLSEKEALENELQNLSGKDENERRRAANVISEKLNRLQERIVSAREIDLKNQPRNEVRFGAIVTYQFEDDLKKHTFQIVGVDEADINSGKIAFVAPISRALTGNRAGDQIDFKLGTKIRKMKILQIDYPS